MKNIIKQERMDIIKKIKPFKFVNFRLTIRLFKSFIAILGAFNSIRKVNQPTVLGFNWFRQVERVNRV